jgi:hypothetical protein
MWKLIMRGARGTPFTELGSFANLADAARVILENEGDPLGALFFRVYVDPPMQRSDADILSNLAYQGAKHYYVLTRSTN